MQQQAATWSCDVIWCTASAVCACVRTCAKCEQNMKWLVEIELVFSVQGPQVSEANRRRFQLQTVEVQRRRKKKN